MVVDGFDPQTLFAVKAFIVSGFGVPSQRSQDILPVTAEKFVKVIQLHGYIVVVLDVVDVVVDVEDDVVVVVDDIHLSLGRQLLG